MMGKNMAPAAVLEINSVIKVPTRQMAVITTIGLVPQTSRMPKASRSAIPVFCMATPKTTEPANTISMSQLMAFMAWSALQQRKMSIAAAAMKAHCSNGMTPSAESATMAIMIVVEMSVPIPIFGTSSESKKCRSLSKAEVPRLTLFGHTSNSVSPACSTTSRGALSIRSPRRATAASVTLLSFSNVLPPIFLPIRLLPKSTYAVCKRLSWSTSLIEKIWWSELTNWWLTATSISSSICPA